MLYEIICNEFKKKRIEFHSRLNTVLGTETGDNSIGKSTFLLVVDFAFGGTTYAESLDIIKNVGPHEIYFSFIFDGINYYFSRETVKYREVYICNDNYEKKKNISLDEFCKWLDVKYDMNIPYLTFRNSIGRYIRVYGKNNANEKLPLHIVPSEKMKDACYALLKLFNLYFPVHQMSIQASNSTEKFIAYRNAQNLNFIDNINKREYTKNDKTIAQLNKELDCLSKNVERGFTSFDAEISDEAIRLKKFLSNARRKRNNIKIRLESITEDSDYKFSITTDDFHELKEFFPNANLQKIKAVEQFHKNISSIFRSEINEEKKKLISELKDYNDIIADFENQLGELIGSPQISNTILKKYSELIRQIDKLKLANDRYDESLCLKCNKFDDHDRLVDIEKKQFTILQNAVNSEMKTLNDYIYNGKYNAPTIHFSNGRYNFFTPDDTGTGVAYKGLVVFDLAVLHLTKLPVIIHDSILLKQISDTALEKILESYDNNGKQVIIALDKQNSYTDVTCKLLYNKSVLSLGPNGNELFGRSWG